jgi:hypothetical protein
MAFLTHPAGRFLLVLGALVLPVSLHGAQRTTIEEGVKAAYLFNFTKFVEWPATGAPSDPFRICIIGAPRFAAAVDDIIKGESAYGRPLARTEPQTADEARQCRVLFIGRGDADRGVRMLAAVRGLPVLTVADTSAPAPEDAVIRFVLEGNRLRFDIFLESASNAGLKISSKLLRVARAVAGGTR